MFHSQLLPDLKNTTELICSKYKRIKRPSVGISLEEANMNFMFRRNYIVITSPIFPSSTIGFLSKSTRIIHETRKTTYQGIKYKNNWINAWVNRDAFLAVIQKDN